jgi:alkylation response protein AidB-like acyl-CoA dehydrogenase
MERVKGIEPTLRACAADAERDRRLPDVAFQAMREQGLYKMWKPKAYGGMETDPMTAFRVFEEVSRIDSAAGWNLQLSTAGEILGAWFPEEGAREIFGPDAVLAGSFFPPRKAIPVEGGYRVSGQQSFVSGAHQATGIVGMSNIYDSDDGPRMSDGVPVSMMTACPASEAVIVDTWRTMGMRGTGSHDVLLQDVFVPESRTALFVPLEKPGPAYQGPLYRMSVSPVVSALATVALGIGRAAVDDLIALAGRKTPSYTAKPLRERDTIHAMLGEAEATLGAARAFLYEALEEAWEAAVAGKRIDMPGKMKLQLGATHAAQAAARTVDLVHAAAGTSGIREEHRFQRHFRDAHTITQHAFISASRYESGGQYMLGVPIEWPFYGI